MTDRDLRTPHVPCISSVQNPRVKAAASLRESKERRRVGLFAVEGAREIERALASNFSLQEIFVCDELMSPLAKSILENLRRSPLPKGSLIIQVTTAVMQKLLLREDSDGLFAIFASRSLTLASLNLNDKPLLLAVEDLEKPGNLGALLRSADGAGCDAVVTLGHTVDVFNPQVIRSSLGTVFHIPVVTASESEFLDFCAEKGIQMYAAALTGCSKPYHLAKLSDGCVIILGSEARGLSSFWLESPAVQKVKIPMLGLADSLNVATAGAILIYEALRQRQAEGPSDELVSAKQY